MGAATSQSQCPFYFSASRRDKELWSRGRGENLGEGQVGEEFVPGIGAGAKAAVHRVHRKMAGNAAEGIGPAGRDRVAEADIFHKAKASCFLERS